MKLEETLQQRDQEIMGPATSKEFPHNPLAEEKKKAIDLSKVDAEGTANLDENQREDSGS